MSSIKWATALKDKGHSSLLICSSDSQIHRKASLDKTFETHALKVSDYFSPSAVLKIRKLIKNQNIKTVVAHRMTDLWILAQAMVGLSDVKLVAFARIFLKNNSKKDLLHKLVYSRVNTLIALSEAQREKLLDNLPIDPSKVVIIPNGIDTRKFVPGTKNDLVRRSLGVSGDDQVLIGLVGRLDKQKGQKEFIRAASHLLKKSTNFQFSLIGAETESQKFYEEELRTMIAHLNLEEKITLTGHREDMEEVYRSLDLFVMPSYEENFANTLLEAMASGCVCIATKSGGTGSIINDGVNGYLIEPRSADAILKGIERALEDRASWGEISKSARVKAESEYDLSRVVEKVEVYL